jgi:DNA-binding NarL/FixJ family response regulator
MNASRAGPIRVVIADDDRSIREVLIELIDADESVTLVGVATTGVEAVAICREQQPDVALMDVRMPGGGGFSAVLQLKTVAPTTRVLVLSAYADSGAVTEMIRAGVVGYLVKGTPVPEIRAAIKRASRGEPSLSQEVAPVVVEELREQLRRDGDAREQRREGEARSSAAGRGRPVDRLPADRRHRDAPAERLRGPLALQLDGAAASTERVVRGRRGGRTRHRARAIRDQRRDRRLRPIAGGELRLAEHRPDRCDVGATPARVAQRRSRPHRARDHRARPDRRLRRARRGPATDARAGRQARSRRCRRRIREPAAHPAPATRLHQARHEPDARHRRSAPRSAPRSSARGSRRRASWRRSASSASRRRRATTSAFHARRRRSRRTNAAFAPVPGSSPPRHENAPSRWLPSGSGASRTVASRLPFAWPPSALGSPRARCVVETTDRGGRGQVPVSRKSASSGNRDA